MAPELRRRPLTHGSAAFAMIFTALLSACDAIRDRNPTLSAGLWAWVAGSATINQPGTYGTKGVPGTDNIPGTRCSAVSWLGQSGKLWQFGGWGFAATVPPGNLNDLWQYDPATAEWTWISGSDLWDMPGVYGTHGIPSPDNVPGARGEAAAWVGADGRLWLFGGQFAGSYFVPTANFNDLWVFDPGTNQWTWITGTNLPDQPGIYGDKGVPSLSNLPGARRAACSWTDANGTFWLFGGYGYDSAGDFTNLNDLWSFKPATLEWTWVSGSSLGDQRGVYGTSGVPAPANVPGGRGGAVSWTEPSGRFWIFGGEGRGCFNDLWRFDPATREWTWISGRDAVDQRGVYGTRGVPDTANIPGARYSAVSWTDQNGMLWLFGGSCLVSDPGVPGRFNDVWRYDPVRDEWAWITGSETPYQTGEHGTKGTTSAEACPGSRMSAVSWFDAQGGLWLFGGFGDNGVSSSSGYLYLNELWRYVRQ